MKPLKPFIIFFLASLVTSCGQSSTSNDTTTSPAAPATPPAAATMAPPAASATPSADTSLPASTSSPADTSTPPATSSPSTATSMPPAASSDPATDQQLAQIKQDVQKTVQDLKDYTYDQKEEFFKTIQGDIDELNQEMSQLTAKIDRASDAVKASAKPRLDSLQVELSKLNIEVDEAKTATESIWGDAKIKVQRAYDDAKQAFHDMADWVNQQPTS